TASTYSPGNLTATRYYRRKVSSCNETKYTSALKITVYPALTSGSIGIGTTTICSGTSAGTLTNASSSSGGNGTHSYQWQYSTNGSSWNNISGATASTYAPGSLTGTRWFRRKVASCNETKYSNTVKIT